MERSSRAAARGRTAAASVRPRRREQIRLGRNAGSQTSSSGHPLRVATIALATAGIVVLAGGGDAFWICLPSVLLVTTMSRGRAEGLISAAAVIAAAALPLAGWLNVSRLPSPLLTLLVLAASVTVLLAVRERQERERDALRNVALSDPLTGIANRRLLQSRADYEIARHTRARQKFALVMLDLDGFKLLNDRFGHAAGDELLCDVAGALTHAMRAQDTVARLGGDEFCVLAPETDHPHTLPLARRIAETVAETTAGVETLHASVGIAVFPDDGLDVSSLMHAADERLMNAKRERGHSRSQRRAA